MAEQLVFGADIDNVTIKNINGKLTGVVNVEDGEDEFEVVTNYVEPQEDNEFYVETVRAKLRHKTTQFMTDAVKRERKPRSAPVNESFVDPITADAIVEGTIIKVIPHNIYNKSAIDGYDIVLDTLDGFDKYFSTSDYPNAKAFNAAHAGKTFTVTTHERFARANGHPLVKPTEIQVAYPTVLYEEGTAKVNVEQSASVNVEQSASRLYVNLDLFHLQEVSSNNFTTDSTIIDEYRRAVSQLDLSTLKVQYKLVTTDDAAITGEIPMDSSSLGRDSMLMLNRGQVSDYYNHSYKSEKWIFPAIEVEGFNFKLRVTIDPYVDGNA